MEYRIIDSDNINIIAGDTPLENILLTIARHSYELAEVVSLVGLKHPKHTQKAEEVDWDRYVFPKREHPLPCIDMDYVNGRACKTWAWRFPDGSLILDDIPHVYSKDFLEEVKSELERKAKLLIQ